MSGLDSTTATSATRPLMAAGPMDRADTPARRSGSTWAVSGNAAADMASTAASAGKRTGLRILVSGKGREEARVQRGWRDDNRPLLIAQPRRAGQPSRVTGRSA